MADVEKTYPREHTRQMKQKLLGTVGLLRSEIAVLKDPRARALFETAAEVIGELEKAVCDYDKKNELAWG